MEEILCILQNTESQGIPVVPQLSSVYQLSVATRILGNKLTNLNMKEKEPEFHFQLNSVRCSATNSLENCYKLFLNSHLKSLKMLLEAYGKGRDIYSGKPI
jgi:hypothetical protein